MIKDSNTRGIILSLLLVAVIAAAYFLLKGFSWDQRYRPDGKEPYDTRLLIESLRESNDLRILDSPSANGLDSADLRTAYVFIGLTNYMDSLDADALMRFVERGGRALVAAKERSWWLDGLVFEEMNDSMYYEEEGGELIWYATTKPYEDNYVDTAITLDPITGANSGKQTIINFRYDDKNYNEGWPYFLSEPAMAEGVTAEAIGTFNDNRTNVLLVKKGSGSLILHTTPLAYTNYHFRSEPVFTYLMPLFERLDCDRILLDRYNQTFHPDQDQPNKKKAFKREEGPLEFILRNRSLSWAWYVILVATVLYFLAGARRKQRIIPVRDANVNTSVEFANTMSRLYWKHSDHRKIGLLKWQLFITFVRDRYGMRLHMEQPLSNTPQARLLAIKSGIDQEQIETLLNQASRLVSAEKADNEMLVKLHVSIEKFYANCK